MASIVQRNKSYSVVYTIYDGEKKRQKWETYHSYEAALRRKEQLDLISEWTEKEPFVFSCAVFYQKNIENGESEFDFGMGLREEYAQFLHVKESELVQYYPPCSCVHTCVPSRSGKYLSLESLQEGFRYLKQNGLSLAGDIVTQVACMTKPEEEYFNWHIVWFPIEK